MRRLACLFSIAAASLVAAACASIDADEGAGDAACLGPSCQPVDAGKDQIVADVTLPDGSSTDGQVENPLCGRGCLPDDPAACAEAGPPDAAPEDSGTRADAGSADAAEDAPPLVSDAGPVLGVGCFVGPAGNGDPAATCQAAGSGASGDPCVTASDCAPGFGCIGDGKAAQCRPFCCQGPSHCKEKGTWCAERPLKLEPGQPSMLVPVCVQADDCNLSDPYPCPLNKQCKCAEGTACMLVRESTTACVPPGTGKVGEACPCAPGHVCNQASGVCLKICPTDSSTSTCGSGKCQAVGYMPDGFGVCALGSADGG